MASSELYHALCDYYCRERLYNSVRLSAAEAVKSAGASSDITPFRFWSAVGLALEGGWGSVLEETSSWSGDPQLELVSLLLQLYCLQCSGQTASVQQLEVQLKQQRRGSTGAALGWAGIFLLQCGEPGRARQYLDRALRDAHVPVTVWVSRAWATMGAGEPAADVQRYLTEAGARDGRHPSLLLCQARAAQYIGQLEASGTHLDTLLALHPSFIPPLLEKMKLALALRDFDQCREMALRSLALLPQCVEALRHSLLLDLGERRAGEALTDLLEQFRQAVYLFEPRNGHFILQSVRVVSRMAGGNDSVIGVCVAMCRQAAKLATVAEAASVELGYLSLMLTRHEQAREHFSAVSREHEASLEPLVGVIWCDLLAGRSDAASGSLEFVKETQQTLGSVSAEVLFLSAMAGRLCGSAGSETVTSLLAECIDVHFHPLRSLPLGIDYLIALNPHFLMLVAEECMLHGPEEPIAPGSAVPRALKLAFSVLEPLTSVCPGLHRAVLLTAECRHLTADWRTAQSLLTPLAERQQPGSEQACLLLAHVLLFSGDPRGASNWLEHALAHSFSVKQQLRYHWLLARVQRSESALVEAAGSLAEAFRLAGLSGLLADQPEVPQQEVEGTQSREGWGRIAPWQLVSELLQIYCCMEQGARARRLLDRARAQLTGGTDRAALAEAEVLMAEGRVLEAVRLLSSITVEQGCFVAARRRMAAIYRDHLNDPRKFAACYREIVEAAPTPASYMLLGDAYMTILEPERALDVYQTAVKRNPRNHELALKMGRALVQTHHYDRAVNYYREAIRAGGDDQLRCDMAELLIRMRQYDRAERAIEQGLQHFSGAAESSQDLSVYQLRTHVKLLKLLAQVHELVAGQERALSSLQLACEAEQRVLKRVQVQLSQREAGEARRTAVATCCKLAQLQQQWLHLPAAELSLRRAAELAGEDQYGEEGGEPLVQLARLYLQSGRLDDCRQTCRAVLQRQPRNDRAATLMADVSFRCGEFSTALQHYERLLEQCPRNFTALAAVVDLLRRMGRRAEIAAYLERAGASCSDEEGLRPAGLLLCKGLADWYCGRRDEALRCLNEARGQAPWRLRVARCMIEIYLHQALDSKPSDGQRDVCLRNVRMLLPLFSPHSGEHRLLAALTLVAAGSRGAAEQALAQLEPLSEQLEGPERVAALWGLGLAHLQLQRGTRARELLNTAAECVWTPDCGEALQSCWLRLAALQVQSGAAEAAAVLLERALSFNQSCGAAHLLLAEIHERGGAWQLSIAGYQQAWQISEHADPSVGYRLACAHLKSRRYVEAIQACHQVLKRNPNYPKIRKEILEKARALLKT